MDVRAARAGLALLLLSSLAACVTAPSQPWAEVSGDTVAVGDSSTSAVQFLAVDGHTLIGSPASVQMQPGLRVLTLASVRDSKSLPPPPSMMPRPAARFVSATTVPLDARPCMRYRIQARHEEGHSSRRWRAEMARIEPIAQCFSSFPKLPPPPPALDLKVQEVSPEATTP